MTFVAASAILQVAGYSLLAARLIRIGLARTYRCFTVFLIFEAIRVGAAAAIPRRSDTYALFYFATQPILWAFHALITLEVFQVAFRRQPGIATLSRKIVAVCVGGSALLSIASAAVDVQTHQSKFRILENYLTLERVVNSSLLGFIILLMLALSWFPIPLTKNALAHAAIFAFFFAAKTGQLLLRNIYGPEITAVANVILLSATVISLVLWVALLRREGETQPILSGYRRNAAEEERLLAQLETINSTLMRSTKK